VRRPISRLVVVIFLQVASTTSHIQAQVPEVRLFALILETTERICNEARIAGSASSEGAKGVVDAELQKLASQLGTAGVGSAGRITTDEYQGILREHLASNITSTARCKLQVFESLQAKLLPINSPPETSLIPVRQYLRAQSIPPAGAGAYGLVVFQSKPTPASQRKLMMVCHSFIAFFPRSETSHVSISDQMVTVWPLDEPDSEKAKADDCDFVLKHYDLVASAAAMNDARMQHATFNGEGPYLVGWSPSNARGLPDKLVLVIDMSADNTQEAIDHKFLFWKNKIIQDPAAWRGGWSIDALRIAIKQFADQYGSDLVKAITLVGAKTP
jgi:hypothetical protein